MNNEFHRLAIQADIKTLFGVELENYTNAEKKVEVKTNIGTFDTSKLIICTNGFAGKFIKDETILPARAQVLVTNVIPDLKIKGTFHYDRGYYYFRNIDGRLLFGGGRNLALAEETTENMENTDLITNRLKQLLDEVILPESKYEIDYSWAGIMGVGNTKKPIVKQIDEHVYCGVRLGGMGVAIGSLVGQELSELIK